MAAFIICVSSFCFYFLLFSIVHHSNCEQNDSYVQHLSYDEFQTFISHNSVRLVFFNPTVETNGVVLFLNDYETAAEDLSRYEIKLGLLDCSSVSENISYCLQNDVGELSVRGFRKSVEKIALPLETLYDANSIVASTLHLTLIHSVPIVQQMSERQELESHCKAKCVIVFTFQRILGTHEHRVFIEVAYQFMNKYMFALTTSESTTIGLRRLQTESESNNFLEEPAVWILHCDRVDTDSTDDCPQTIYRQQMEFELFLQFVKMIELPDWFVIEDGNGNLSSSIYSNYNLNSVYFLYDKSTEENVKQLAPKLGLWFKGSVGVLGINLDKVSGKSISEMGFCVENLKLPSVGFKKHNSTKISVMNDYDNAYKFISDQLFFSSLETSKGIGILHQNFVEPISELDELQQDDEIAKLINEYQVTEENLRTAHALIDVTYLNLINSKKFVVVLFYLNWDSVSQIAVRLFSSLVNWKPFLSDLLYTIDCFEWTDICVNISIYPTIQFISSSGEISIYNGALKIDNLFTAIQLNQIPNPLPLNNSDQVWKFSRIDESYFSFPLTSVVLVGVESSNFDEYFISLGNYYRGKYLIGKCISEVCAEIMEKFSLKFPFLITFKPKDKFEDFVIFKEEFNEKNLRSFISFSSMEKFAKLTPINFGQYRKLNKPLVVFFRNSNENETEFNLIGQILLSDKFSYFVFVWMDLYETAAKNILGSFSSKINTNISLIVIDYEKTNWYRYYKNIWNEGEITNWLENIKNKKETQTGVLAQGEWKPRLPGFDYLKFIEEDQIRDVEEKFNSEVSPDSSDSLQQSRIYRYPGSSEKKYKNKMNDVKIDPHSEL